MSNQKGKTDRLFWESTNKIIRAAYSVHRVLGFGFLENVYEKALAVELQRRSMSVIRQKRIEVVYAGCAVGEYFADLLVEDKIIVEIKSVERIARQHEVQLVNYLKGTDKEVGLLINFGQSVTVRRRLKGSPRAIPVRLFRVNPR